VSPRCVGSIRKKFWCSNVCVIHKTFFWYVNKFKLKLILKIIKNVKNYLTTIYHRPAQCHSHLLPLQSSLSYLNKKNYIIIQCVISCLLRSTELTVRRDTSRRLKWPDVSPFKSFSRELSNTEKIYYKIYPTGQV